MARAPRIEFAGAIYHVMSRGNHLEPIVRDDADRALWIKTLGEAGEGAGWRIHAFVLMRNHYHLLLETVRANLVRGIQTFNATYTRRYNVCHRTDGHLFQGRYKALLVDPEAEGYFLAVSDYVHLNPGRDVDGHLLGKPTDWIQPPSDQTMEPTFSFNSYELN